MNKSFKHFIIVAVLFTTVTSNCFGQKKISMTQKEVAHKMDSIVAAEGFRTFRASVMFGLGVGFKRLDVFELQDGTISSISAGGGIHIGAEMGVHMIKQLELALGFRYGASTLSYPVENASASFSRLVLTPMAYYDLRIGKRSHINIGAGVGIFFKGRMIIDGWNLTPATYIEAYYKTAYSPDVAIWYQVYFNKKLTWSMRGGLNAYFPTYHLTEFYYNGGSYPPSAVGDETVKNFNGSGLDIFFGMNYHFL